MTKQASERLQLYRKLERLSKRIRENNLKSDTLREHAATLVALYYLNQ